MRRHFVFGQPVRRMFDEIVHRSRHGPIQGLGKADCAAGRGDEPLIRKRLPVVFHKLTDGAQRPLDEAAVVGDPLAVHHARIQRCFRLHGMPAGRADRLAVLFPHGQGDGGQNQGEAGVVAIFAQKMLTDQHPIINGSGEQTRDYVYAEDVARINLMVLKNEIRGAYNVGTGKETTVNDLFHRIKSLTLSETQEVHGEPKKGEQFRSVLSAEKAHRELGWKPLIGFDEGLKKTVSFFRSTLHKGESI